MLHTTTQPLQPKIASDDRFAPDAKVWFYPASRTLTDEEVSFVEAQLLRFCENWTAHNQALKATAEVFAHRYLILMVDESQASASGCSIDKSVHFLEQLGEHMGVDFFDRMTFAWQAEDRILTGNLTDFTSAVKRGNLQFNTLVLNSLAPNRAALLEQLWLPFEQSWQRRLL